MTSHSRLTEESGRLSLDGYDFSCGSPIVLLIADVEVKGWLEYSRGDVGNYTGWYFVGKSWNVGWCPVVAGMRARRG